MEITGDTKIFERDIDNGLPYEGSGLLAAGLNGSTSASALMERQSKVAEYKDRMDFREVVPCDKCSCCMELRGFTVEGRDVCLGYYCINGSFEVSSTSTCHGGRLGKRKKVVYVMKNAPKDFGLRPNDVDITDQELQTSTERRRARKDYRGGSGVYQRIDGKSLSEGGGTVPRSLMN
jgi:hypothetical protein